MACTIDKTLLCSLFTSKDIDKDEQMLERCQLVSEKLNTLFKSNESTVTNHLGEAFIEDVENVLISNALGNVFSKSNDKIQAVGIVEYHKTSGKSPSTLTSNKINELINKYHEAGNSEGLRMVRTHVGNFTAPSFHVNIDAHTKKQEKLRRRLLRLEEFKSALHQTLNIANDSDDVSPESFVTGWKDVLDKMPRKDYNSANIELKSLQPSATSTKNKIVKESAPDKPNERKLMPVVFPVPHHKGAAEPALKADDVSKILVDIHQATSAKGKIVANPVPNTHAQNLAVPGQPPFPIHESRAGSISMNNVPATQLQYAQPIESGGQDPDTGSVSGGQDTGSVTNPAEEKQKLTRNERKKLAKKRKWLENQLASDTREKQTPDRLQVESPSKKKTEVSPKICVKEAEIVVLSKPVLSEIPAIDIGSSHVCWFDAESNFCFRRLCPTPANIPYSQHIPYLSFKLNRSDKTETPVIRMPLQLSKSDENDSTKQLFLGEMRRTCVSNTLPPPTNAGTGWNPVYENLYIMKMIASKPLPVGHNISEVLIWKYPHVKLTCKTFLMRTP